MIVPPATASTTPTTTYAIAIFQLNMLASKITDAKSTKGEDIKKENVTPIGNPALVKPINKGIEEQEQNGVTVPSKALNMLAETPLNLPSIFLVLSGGKKLCIYEIAKIKTESKINIFITS
jgi:hypothetical protein